MGLSSIRPGAPHGRGCSVLPWNPRVKRIPGKLQELSKCQESPGRVRDRLDQDQRGKDVRVVRMEPRGTWQ
jgi:hypothetical protein